MAIRLKNATSSVSRIGYLVSINPTDPNSFVYTTPNSTKVVGIITEAVPYRQFCNIATIGDKASVYVVGNVVKGNIIRSTKSNDRVSLGACTIARAGDAPYLRIGEALNSGSGLINVVLDLQYVGDDIARLTNHEANPSAHHAKYTDAEAVTAVATADVYLLNSGDTATGNYNFDSGTLFVDATNHRVGIGTDSPGTKLDLLGTIAAPVNVRITNSGGSWVIDNEVGRFSFYTTDTSGVGVRELASIRAINTNTAVSPSAELAFYYGPYNAATLEAMRINKLGYVGIGDTSPSYPLDVTGRVRSTLGRVPAGTLHGTYTENQIFDALDSSVPVVGNKIIITGGAGNSYTLSYAERISSTRIDLFIYDTTPPGAVGSLPMVNGDATTIDISIAW